MQTSHIWAVFVVALTLQACPTQGSGPTRPAGDTGGPARVDATVADAPAVPVRAPASPEDKGPPDATAEPIVKSVEIRVAGGTLGARQAIDTRYETRKPDSLFEKLRERDEGRDKKADDETAAIRKRQKEDKKRHKRERKRLRSSLPQAERPTSLGVFTIIPHNPPIAQHRTGTCWSFASTSLMESETRRITGREIALSQMGTVYGEYLNKATRVIEERGDSFFGQGSENDAILRVYRTDGAWPLEAYRGVDDGGLHDHTKLFSDLNALLGHLKARGEWDVPTAGAMVRVILDRYLGPRPDHFDFDGQTTTPREFVTKVLRLDLEAYVDVMSTLAQPFYEKGRFEVPDNWWKGEGYHNAPLDEFVTAFKGALEKGYSVAIALDVSEPGIDPPNDVMFIPDYDIPGERIDQLAREYRLSRGITTDDHAVHVVGYAHVAGHDWFLAKDSARAARYGKHKGYFFIRDDYIRLKMLAFTVQRDAIGELLAKF